MKTTENDGLDLADTITVQGDGESKDVSTQNDGVDAIPPAVQSKTNSHTGETDSKWYVMRVYQNERKAKEALSNEKHGLKYFIPMEKVIRTYHGKKIVCEVPVIRSLVFVFASREEIIHFKQNYYNDLQFVIWNCDGYMRYLTVPDKEMDSFMLVYLQKEKEVTFYKPGDEELEKALKRGDRIHIHGGLLDGLEGYVAKVSGKRSKQIIVVIPDALAIATAQVNDGIIEVTEKAKKHDTQKMRKAKRS